MNPVRNPYTPMLLTYNPRFVYGRENVIISILQVITAQEPNGHAIYGLRSIGKTTLLKYLKDENGALRDYADYTHADYRRGGRKRLLFVYLNFHHFGEGDSIFYAMLEELREEIENDLLVEHTHIPLIDADMSRQQIFNILRAVLNQLQDHDVRVVFLLDDFDIPLETIDENDDRLLRSLSDSAALIIATEAPISELRPDIGESSPLLGILRPEAIDLLTADAARRLIREPLQNTGITLTADEENLLLEVGGRQPFLLTTACELYFAMRQENMGMHTANQQVLKTQFIYRLAGLPHVNSIVQRIWGRLDDEERTILFQMAAENGGASLDAAAARLANKSLAYWDSQRGHYRVFSDLFADFIRRSYAGVKEQESSILAGKASIENLTPIDRALLDYFLAHPNRTCTFDELLDAVWEDNEKSKRALEAAVFRLRKSLGEGEQIKNIRGKGYKFVTN